ncbi:MAG: hypothetical protein QOJ07_1574 [Thermoleophilaceae bacterium]|nr:hypothetical protein [Thermoleophilaceae bacterium]
MSRFASYAASAGLGAAFAAVAFVAKGGQVIGSASLVELLLIAGCGLLATAAIVWGREGGLSGTITLALFGVLAALTALSVTWSITPDASWIETNRTIAYLAVFAAALGAARLAPEGWLVLLRGLLIGAAAIVIYALASRVWPASIAPDELYSRLAQPFSYWNALGVTAALAVPPAIWLGARRSGHAAFNALAYPLLALILVALFLSFSRGAIAAAAIGSILWLAIVPLRLRSVTVLAVSGAFAAPVLLWALTKRAFTESQVPLPVRERVATDFGVLLLVMIVLTLAAGLTLGFRIARDAPSATARLRFGGAMAAIALIAPIVMFAGIVSSDRGIDARVSDFTNPKAAPPAAAGADRFTTASSSRAQYWKQSRQIFSDHPLLGTGAGTFGTARLRYRPDAQVARQAHGFLPQTMSDLGIAGLIVALLLLAAWLIAAARATGLRRRDRGSPWPPERVGLVALTATAVVFGIHSAIDWTWFVPGPAVMALAAAGYVAGTRRPGVEGVAAATADTAAPSRFARAPRLAAAAASLVAVAACAWASWQPALAHNQVNHAYDLVAEGRFDAAAQVAAEAHDTDPLSLEARFARAAVADARGDQPGAERELRSAVRAHRADPAAWLRLAQYQLYTLDKPKDAEQTITRGVIPLDRNNREAAYAYFEARMRQRGGTAAAGAPPG